MPGWAVLAAGALVASIFAVGAAPAAAANPIDETGLAQINASSGKTACLGPALADAGFTDMDGSVHQGAVNCIAYYGITAGTSEGVFGAGDSVTRSQMALFLSAMAALAGLTLEDAMDAGFTDLADTAANRVNAINRLVNGKIMTGTSATTFSPEAAVTRADMALWLANFMDATTDNDSDYNVERQRDGTYKITQAAPTVAEPANRSELRLDYFKDARLTQPVHVDSAISVAFEMGITAGYGDNTFKPHRSVTRAEMASFITATLAHTNLRPANLTAQHDGKGGIQVSMRDANFKPIANVPLDLFGTFFEDDAFKADGTCETRYVNPVYAGEVVNTACRIDDGDTTTEADGNKDYTSKELETASDSRIVVCGTGAAALRFNIAAATKSKVVFWVWTDDYNETVDADTDLVRVGDVTGTPRPRLVAPTHALVSLSPDSPVSAGEAASKVHALEARMGARVHFTLQLRGEGTGGTAANAGPDSSGNVYIVDLEAHRLVAEGHTGDGDGFTDVAGAGSTRDAVRVQLVSTFEDEGTEEMEVSVGSGQVESFKVTPGPDGSATFSVTYPDPGGSSNRDNPDVVMTVTVKAFRDVPADHDDYNKIGHFVNDALNTEATAAMNNEDPPAAVTGRTEGFETRVIFSDDKPRPYMFKITAKTPAFRIAQGLTIPVASYVDVSAVDQYGRPVRGLSVNAISASNTNTAGTSTFPFVQYFTTGSRGDHRVNYSYRGGAGIETVRAFAAIKNQQYDSNGDDVVADPDGHRLPDRDTTPGDRVLESPEPEGTADFWNLLLPRRNADTGETLTADHTAKPIGKVYWVGIGKEVNSPTGGYTFASDADTGLLRVDTSEKAFVVLQAEVAADSTTTPETKAVPGGPHVYFWDQYDNFQVTDSSGLTHLLPSGVAGMEMFERIFSTAQVSATTLSWQSYDYNRPRDTATWTVTCAGPAPPA